MTRIIKTSVLITFIICALFVTYTTSYAQSVTSSGPDFKIAVEVNGDKVNLECTRGCAWRQLSFSLPDGSVQYIDENGMAAEEDDATRTMDMADFHISFQKKDGGIECLSSHSTGWTNLSFQCAASRCSADIDASGVTLR